jgi:hypothetical protein
MLKFASPLLISAIIAGCISPSRGTSVGVQFSRQITDGLIHNSTTKQDILSRMGNPVQKKREANEGFTFELIKYVYITGPIWEGLQRSKWQVFIFYNDVLVGHEYSSSFEEDSTYFNSKCLDNIIRQKTTNKDVNRMLGHASGKYVYPVNYGSRRLTKNESADLYFYDQFKKINGIISTIHKKALVVIYDADGVVADVIYRETGNEEPWPKTS